MIVRKWDYMFFVGNDQQNTYCHWLERDEMWSNLEHLYRLRHGRMQIFHSFKVYDIISLRVKMETRLYEY